MRSTIGFGILALAYAANAETIMVDVGNGGLKFNPSSITANVDDVIEFHFYPQDHDVVQGSFDKPCQVGSVTNGFFSGFVPTSKGESPTVFRVTVNSTDPAYFYCSQVSHCQNGMVGAINAPSSGNTVAAYLSAAGQTSDSETPSGSASGGVLASGSDDGSSSSSSSSSSSTSASSASSMSSAAAATTGSGSSSSASQASTSASASASGGSATSASTSAKATTNAAAEVGRMSFEMLGLGVVAGGVALLM